ncbi:unnamed protein product [Thlaspi arvense]|uniref:Uncharacterized protein n=1 Tax=Thlaspi arvense TaxID=13288 RepID=A0AAU9T8U4_THLAR|nr:unnamed protein product [Thlaspi arvense]
MFSLHVLCFASSSKNEMYQFVLNKILQEKVFKGRSNIESKIDKKEKVVKGRSKIESKIDKKVSSFSNLAL